MFNIKYHCLMMNEYHYGYYCMLLDLLLAKKNEFSQKHRLLSKFNSNPNVYHIYLHSTLYFKYNMCVMPPTISKYSFLCDLKLIGK